MSTKKSSLSRSRLPSERDAKVIGASFSSDIGVYTHHDGAALARATTLEGAVREAETGGRASSATDPGETISRTSGSSSYKESSAWLRRWDKRQKLEKEWRFERSDGTLVTSDARPASNACSIPRSERDSTVTDRSTTYAQISPISQHHRQMSPTHLQPSDAVFDRQNTLPSLHLVVDNRYPQLALPSPLESRRAQPSKITSCSGVTNSRSSPLEHECRRNKQTQRSHPLNTSTCPQHQPPPPVPPTSPASQHGDFVVLQTADYQNTSPTLDDITAERFDLIPNSPDWHYLRALDRLEGRRMGPRTPSSRSDVIPDSPTLKGLGIQGLSSAPPSGMSYQSFQDRTDPFGKVKPDRSSETSSDLSLLREELATFKQMAMIAAKQAAAQTEKREGSWISGARTDSVESRFRAAFDSPDTHVARQHLLVKRSPKHENLVPERDSTFLKNIKECAKQEAVLRAAIPSYLQPTHPAFRNDVGPIEEQERDDDGLLKEQERDDDGLLKEQERDDDGLLKEQERDWAGSEDKQTPILESLHLRRQFVENLQQSTRQRLIDRRLEGKSAVDVSNLQQQKQQHETDTDCELPSLTLDARRASSASMLLPFINHAFILSPHRSSEGDLRARWKALG